MSNLKDAIAAEAPGWSLIHQEDYETLRSIGARNQPGGFAGLNEAGRLDASLLDPVDPSDLTVPMVVDSLDTLKTMTDILAGKMYYVRESGRQGFWQYITAPETGVVEDGGTVLVRTDGKVLQRVYHAYVPVSWFGVKGIRYSETATTGADDSVAFQLACNMFAGNSPVTLVFAPGRKYFFKNTVEIPYNVSIDGQNSTFIPITGGSFANNFMFYVNMRISDGSHIEDYGGRLIANIRNIFLDNSNSISTIKAFSTKSKTSFFNLSFVKFSQAIYKSGNSDFEFTDQITLEKLYFFNCPGNEYQISINYHGDGLLINQCHLVGAEGYGHNFLEIKSNSGGKIMNCINGNIRIINSKALSLENYHCEHGEIYIEASGVTLRNIYQWKEFTTIPLTITRQDSDKRGYPVVIENYAIVYKYGQEWSNNLPAGNADFIDAYFNDAIVSIRNFYRQQDGSVLGIGINSAVTVSIDGTTVWDEWQNQSSSFSKNSTVLSNKVVSAIESLSFPASGAAYTVSAPIVLPDTNSHLGAGTFYYRYMLLFGPKDRMVARTMGTNAQLSVTLATAGNSVSPNFTYHPDLVNAVLRLYRGTASENFDSYVDVPYINGDKVRDWGTLMSNGSIWKPRTPGAIDIFNTDYTAFRQEGNGNVTYYGPASPAGGTWKPGDRIINPAATPGSPCEWMCSVGGTPGTWFISRNLAQPELLANKASNFSVIDNNRYPTTQAVQDYVTSRINPLRVNTIKLSPTADYTIASTDGTIIADMTAGNFFFYLPPLSIAQGRTIYLQKIDTSANGIALKASGTEKIGNGTATGLSLTAQGQYVRIQGAVDRWVIMDKGTVS
jgi:hypothetical protein